MNDVRLAAALAADLDGNFEQLVRGYQHQIYAYALGIARDPRDAEEIAQDAFVRAYRALQSYPVERARDLALRPWLFTIALNLSRNKLRGRRAMTLPLEYASNGTKHDPPDEERERPESRALAKLEAAQLRAAIERLPEHFRQAVVLRHVMGLPYHEAADILSQPVGTVKANVHRGTRMLRAHVTSMLREEYTHA